MRLTECYFQPSGGGSIVIEERISPNRAGYANALKDIIDSSTMYRAESYPVRTPGGWHVLSLLPVVCLATILFGAICLLPGVRHWRLAKAGSLLWAVATGFSVVCALQQPGWTSVDGWLDLPLSYTLPAHYRIQLTLFCGLQGVDITLRSIGDEVSSDLDGGGGGGGELHHWHAFMWPSHADSLSSISRSALYAGLPWPMIDALDNVLAQAGHELRRAGYISSWLLAAGGYSWLVGVWLLLVERAAVKPLTARVVLTTGVLIVASAATYMIQLPVRSVSVRFDDGHRMSLEMAWCFWLVIASGSANVTVGAWLILGEYMSYSETKSSTCKRALSNVEKSTTRNAGGPVLSMCWPRRSSKLSRHKSSRDESAPMNIPLNNLGQRRQDSTGVLSGSQSSGTLRMRHSSSPWKTPGSMPRRSGSSTYGVKSSTAQPPSSLTGSDLVADKSTAIVETTSCGSVNAIGCSCSSSSHPSRRDIVTCLDHDSGSNRRIDRSKSYRTAGYSMTMIDLSDDSSDPDD